MELPDNKINFYLTPKCKYKCSYCTLYDNSLEHPAFDYDGWTIMLNNYKNVEIHIYGGEPFEHPDIYKIIKFLSSFKHVGVNVLTNGSRVNLELVQKYKVNILLSYHPMIPFSKFMKMAAKLKPVLTRVSYMFEKDIKRRIKEYVILQKMFPEIDTLFCPIVNEGVGTSPAVDELVADKEIMKKFFKDKEYHFKLSELNNNTINLQHEHGMFFVQTGEVNCRINDTTIEVYNNHIFRCASELHYNLGLTNYKQGTHVKDYEIFKKNITHKCSLKYCSVFDHKHRY